jgi:ribosomal protein S18 acetylase RimI-like enzyme
MEAADSFHFETLSKEMLVAHLPALVEMASRNIKDEYWRDEHFLHELPDKWRFSFIVFLNTRLCGFLIASQKEGAVHIHKFVVDNWLQGRGVGTAMLNHLRKQISAPITLKVHQSNTKALRFYRKHGFELQSSHNDLNTLLLAC